MDAKISEKEERLQPEGLVFVHVNDVFDFYPVLSEDNFIENIAILTSDSEDIQQGGLFASLKQLGSDPLAPADGNRWAETFLGELAPDVLLTDIKNSVASVSTSCAVIFDTVKDANGQDCLTYDIRTIL